ncbi:MAG: hypothetical protein B7C24_03000 [Bacteroidetes bacterium 4572_77]|nr:MAG: hypothetical protein B7C24_03000 [Bacteroidetes bacterium 4572_77]
MKRINHQIAHDTTLKAKQSERSRMNYNFHPTLDDPIQRMLNALEPETYLPPHRHVNPHKVEIFLVLKGKVLVVEFDDNGSVIDHQVLDPLQGGYGCEIAAGVWHTLISLESGTVVYELKKGPFSAISEHNFATWAPKANDEKAKDYQLSLLRLLGVQQKS